MPASSSAFSAKTSARAFAFSSGVVAREPSRLERDAEALVEKFWRTAFASDRKGRLPLGHAVSSVLWMECRSSPNSRFDFYRQCVPAEKWRCRSFLPADM